MADWPPFIGAGPDLYAGILGQEAGAAHHTPLSIISPTSLEGRSIPERQWIVQDWLPVGVVTLSYGDGGVGKTLLSQQLATACVTGRPWLGLDVLPCNVFALFCEDDEGEVHRRQDRINRVLGVRYADLGGLRYACAVGADNVLLRFDRDGSWRETPRLAEITKAAKDHGAKLIIIDTAADTFGGNENDRAQVRAYLGALLAKLARDTGAAVLVNAHPSRSGLSTSGDMDGGSTAWSNTARSRWALVRPPAEDGAEPDDTHRILSRRKANYSSIGDTIDLRWTDGVLIPAHLKSPSSLETATRMESAERIFLHILDRCHAQNIRVSASRTAGNFAPKVFAKRPERDGFTRQDFEVALNRLLATNAGTNVQYGRKGDERFRLGRPDAAPEKNTDPELEEWRDACSEAGFPVGENTPDQGNGEVHLAAD